VTDNDSPHAPTRRATCACGQLAIECVGEPVRVSVCHCLDCKRRSGSAFATQARFPNDRVTISGQSKQWTRTGDEGGKGVMDFCPDCGSRLWASAEHDPQMYNLRLGGVRQRAQLAPKVQVWCNSSLPWSMNLGGVKQHPKNAG